jgi:hypothetical protein
LMLHSKQHARDAQVDDLPFAPSNVIDRSDSRRPFDLVSTRAPRVGGWHSVRTRAKLGAYVPISRALAVSHRAGRGTSSAWQFMSGRGGKVTEKKIPGGVAREQVSDRSDVDTLRRACLLERSAGSHQKGRASDRSQPGQCRIL